MPHQHLLSTSASTCGDTIIFNRCWLPVTKVLGVANPTLSCVINFAFSYVFFSFTLLGCLLIGRPLVGNNMSSLQTQSHPAIKKGWIHNLTHSLRLLLGPRKQNTRMRLLPHSYLTTVDETTNTKKLREDLRGNPVHTALSLCALPH